jgi:hypothetical protein
MKKLLVGLFSVAFVGLVWIGFNDKESEVDAVDSENKKPIVNTAKDEDIYNNGTLSDGIHNTSLWLDELVVNIQSFKEMKKPGPLMDYVKGAVGLAEKVNASKEIKGDLNKVLRLTEQGLAEEDISKLRQANEILLNLDYGYNFDVLSNYELERIEAKLK